MPYLFAFQCEDRALQATTVCRNSDLAKDRGAGRWILLRVHSVRNRIFPGWFVTCGVDIGFLEEVRNRCLLTFVSFGPPCVQPHLARYTRTGLHWVWLITCGCMLCLLLMVYGWFLVAGV